MQDLQQLLRIAQGAQIVTDEDIRTLEDVRARLGMSMSDGSTLTARQVCMPGSRSVAQTDPAQLHAALSGRPRFAVFTQLVPSGVSTP